MIGDVTRDTGYVMADHDLWRGTYNTNGRAHALKAEDLWVPTKSISFDHREIVLSYFDNGAQENENMSKALYSVQ